MTKRNHPKHWKFATVHDRDLGPNTFRAIPGTGGTYQISKLGQVISQRHRSLPAGYWIILRHNVMSGAKPYNRVAIVFDGESGPKMCQVSRLILEAWAGPPPSEFHVAAHRNGKSDDDRLNNLKWATHEEVKAAQACRGTLPLGEKVYSARMTQARVTACRRIVVEFGVPANLLATALDVPNTRVIEWLTKTWDHSKWEGIENPLQPEDGK